MTTDRTGAPAVADPLGVAGEVFPAVAEALGLTLLRSRCLGAEPTATGVIVGYDLDLASGTGTCTVETHTVYLETNPTGPERDGVLDFRAEDGDDRVSVWLYPRDPELPALPAAVYPEAAAILLDRIGLRPTDPGQLTVTLAAYRPGKRAVVRLTAPEFTVFLKVVRPKVAARLHARHESWRAHGLPVPRSLGWSEQGFIVLQSLPGLESGRVLDRLPPNGFLDAVDDLTARLATITGTDPARRSLVSRLPWYLDRVRALHPEHDAALTAIGAAIERMRGRGSPTPVTIHGDLHLGQIFVDPGQPTTITGLLDIDTAGQGDPADDAAAFYAHLAVTALHHRERGEPVLAGRADELARLARARWDQRGHADTGYAERVRAIAATHLLGHILARGTAHAELLSAAGDLLGVPVCRPDLQHENPLTAATGRSHLTTRR